MKCRFFASNILAGMLLALSGAAFAMEEVSVGRVDLQLPGSGWETYDIPDPGNALTGAGIDHKQRAETKVLLLRAPDQTVNAVFIVRANASGKGRFSGVVFPDAQCKGPAGTFSEGAPPSPAAKSFHCLFVAGVGKVGDPDKFFRSILGPQAEKGGKLAPHVHLVVAKQYANTGAFADITAFVAPELLPEPRDLNQASAEPLPPGVSAASVQWGRFLQQAVTDSVNTVRGKLPVPEFRSLGAPALSN